MKTINVKITEDCGAITEVEVLYEIVDDSFDYEYGSINGTEMAWSFEILDITPAIDKKYMSQIEDAIKDKETWYE
jgi:hypothetical protein